MVERFSIPSLNRDEVLRYLGYGGQELSEELDRRIDEQIERALALADGRGTWQVYPVADRRVREDGVPVVRLEGSSLELPGASMKKHLDGADAVGLLAVTVGMGVERELRRLALTDPLGQVIFDAVGTTLVERVADACEARIVEEAHGRGLHTNFRFSPGYGDLPLTVQPDLLRTLDAQRALGVTLTESLLMIPTKSVSAVIGLFDEPQEGEHVTCVGCRCFDFCRIRRAGTTCRSL